MSTRSESTLGHSCAASRLTTTKPSLATAAAPAAAPAAARARPAATAAVRAACRELARAPATSAAAAPDAADGGDATAGCPRSGDARLASVDEVDTSEASGAATAAAGDGDGDGDAPAGVAASPLIRMADSDAASASASAPAGGGGPAGAEELAPWLPVWPCGGGGGAWGPCGCSSSSTRVQAATHSAVTLRSSCSREMPLRRHRFACLCRSRMGRTAGARPALEAEHANPSPSPSAHLVLYPPSRQSTSLPPAWRSSDLVMLAYPCAAAARPTGCTQLGGPQRAQQGRAHHDANGKSRGSTAPAGAATPPKCAHLWREPAAAQGIPLGRVKARRHHHQVWPPGRHDGRHHHVECRLRSQRGGTAAHRGAMRAPRCLPSLVQAANMPEVGATRCVVCCLEASTERRHERCRTWTEGRVMCRVRKRQHKRWWGTTFPCEGAHLVVRVAGATLLPGDVDVEALGEGPAHLVHKSCVHTLRTQSTLSTRRHCGAATGSAERPCAAAARRLSVRRQARCKRLGCGLRPRFAHPRRELDSVW